MLRRWYIPVGDYARRSLSFEKYLFPATAGLAELVHLEICSDYYAGIWNNGIERGLLWSLNQNGQERYSYPTLSWS